MKQLKKVLLDKYPELAPMSDTSVRKLLKKKLNYSYKKASQRALSALNDKNKRHHIETAIIIEALRRSGVIICFIDEYNVSEEDANLYTWLPKGKEDYIVNLNKAASLKAVAAVTDEQLISLFIQVECFKSDDFRAFLPDAIDRMKALSTLKDRPFVLFYDNAAVHKALKIKEELAHN